MSSIPAVKADLCDRLTAALADTKVQVIYGLATTQTITRPHWIALEKVDGLSDFADMAETREYEEYTILTRISCTLNGPDTQAAATTAAMATWKTAKAMVRGQSGRDEPLGVPGVLAVKALSDFELVETARPEGRNAELVFRFHVRASE